MKSSQRHLSGLLLALCGGLGLLLLFLPQGPGEDPPEGLERGSPDPASVELDPTQVHSKKGAVASGGSGSEPSPGLSRAPLRRPLSTRIRVGDPLPDPLEGRVILASSGRAGAHLRFWVEQEGLWGGEGSSTLVETDDEGRFRLPLGYLRARLRVSRAWVEELGTDPLYELVPGSLQAREGVPLVLRAESPRLVLRVRGRLPDGSFVEQPRISLVGAAPVPHSRWKLEESRQRAYFDRSRMPVRVWVESTQEESVFRLFESELSDPRARAIFRSHAARVGGQDRRRATAKESHVFDTDVALELGGLSGEVRHTFDLQPRPRLRVRLLDGGRFAPKGVEAWARFHSGDLSKGTLDRGRSRWEFNTGWIVPGPCEVHLIDAISRKQLGSRSLVLTAGQDRTLDFASSEIAAASGLADKGLSEPTLAVAGVVRDAAGDHLGDVDLEVSWKGGRHFVHSSRSNGRFGLRLEEHVGPLRVRVVSGIAGGVFRPSQVDVPFGATQLEFLRVDRRAVPLELSFQDARDGELITGLRHCVLFREEGGGGVHQQLEWELDDALLHGEYTPGAGVFWRARVPHYRAAEGRLPELVSAGAGVELRIPLEPGFVERFTVSDAASGVPIAGALLHSFSGVPLGESDAEGLAVVESSEWPEGLRIEARGYLPFELRLDWDGMSEYWDGAVSLRPQP